MCNPSFIFKMCSKSKLFFANFNIPYAASVPSWQLADNRAVAWIDNRLTSFLPWLCRMRSKMSSMYIKSLAPNKDVFFFRSLRKFFNLHKIYADQCWPVKVADTFSCALSQCNFPDPQNLIEQFITVFGKPSILAISLRKHAIVTMATSNETFLGKYFTIGKRQSWAVFGNNLVIRNAIDTVRLLISERSEEWMTKWRARLSTMIVIRAADVDEMS